MTENEQNFVNKINELQNVVEWQKKTISQRESKIKELELIIESIGQDKSCKNCKHFMSNHSFRLGHSDYLNGCRVLITPSDFSCNEFEQKENQNILE